MACTQKAARQGVGVQVAERLAVASRTVDLTVCQAGECRQVPVELRRSTGAVDEGCDGGVCSAKASPTGEGHGFAELPELKTAKARVRVVLREGEGTPVLDRQVTVKPELVYPNGPRCGGEAPQAQLRITSTGDIRVR